MFNKGRTRRILPFSAAFLPAALQAVFWIAVLPIAVLIKCPSKILPDRHGSIRPKRSGNAKRRLAVLYPAVGSRRQKAAARSI